MAEHGVEGRNMIKKSLLIAFVACCFTQEANADAIEITNYEISGSGTYHYVTVAFDNLDTQGWVRCVIKKDNKPVGMNVDGIVGVGTITIDIDGGIKDKTTASCEETKNPYQN